MGDDFVVGVGCDGHGLAAEVAPELDDRFNGVCIALLQWRDEAGAAFKQASGAVFPAGFLGAGHRVRADEVRAWRERGVAEAGDLAFHAADVGHDRARGEVRRDLARERDDFIHRRSQHDERCAAHGLRGGVGHGVAPRLGAQREARIGPACP